MPTVDELYEMVSDLYSRDEFEEKIQKKKEQFDDLFDEEALAYMIVAEEDRNEEAIDEIKEVEPGDECTVEGEIVDLGTLRTFENENGQGSVRNVRIDDGTGSIKVVFWNEETERIEDEFETGMNIRVANGYVQDKGYGKQISTGKWGEVKVLERKKD
ncbi:MAG: OB-fold nucleic acid binding domain-containing protein [Candidatus Thermoplasmatota archaeon]